MSRTFKIQPTYKNKITKNKVKKIITYEIYEFKSFFTDYKTNDDEFKTVVENIKKEIPKRLKELEKEFKKELEDNLNDIKHTTKLFNEVIKVKENNINHLKLNLEEIKSGHL